MSLLQRFFATKPTSASVAKERLSLILARESASGTSGYDFIPELQRELLAVLSKYVQVDLNDIVVQRERQGNLDVLEVKIELPEPPAR